MVMPLVMPSGTFVMPFEEANFTKVLFKGLLLMAADWMVIDRMAINESVASLLNG